MSQAARVSAAAGRGGRATIRKRTRARPSFARSRWALTFASPEGKGASAISCASALI